jgi:cob(I)alamin adenosyltransferase
MGKLKKGYVQVYTGDGKGKTTAAFGLALRAAGYDLQVFIAQFIKGRRYSEIKALEKLKDNITIEQYGRGFFIRKESFNFRKI